MSKLENIYLSLIVPKEHKQKILNAVSKYATRYYALSSTAYLENQPVSSDYLPIMLTANHNLINKLLALFSVMNNEALRVINRIIHVEAEDLPEMFISAIETEIITLFELLYKHNTQFYHNKLKELGVPEYLIKPVFDKIFSKYETYWLEKIEIKDGLTYDEIIINAIYTYYIKEKHLLDLPSNTNLEENNKK